jgi:hypothetical protein
LSYEIDRPAEPVNPGHYRLGKVELIDLVELLTFNLGNAVKYLVRAGKKGDLVEDLKKGIWYAERELFRVAGKKSELAEVRERSATAERAHGMTNDALHSELADYERTVAGLLEQLRSEEARRARYQAVDAAARRFVAEKRRVNLADETPLEFGRQMVVAFEALAVAVDAGKIAP